MMNSWTKAFGDPRVFLGDIPTLSRRFKTLAKVERSELAEIREFVKSRNYEITKDPEALRAVVAAFSVLLTERFGQRLRVRGVVRKKIIVESKGFTCELLDLFYRCVFEGLDLDLDWEVPPSH